MVKGSLINLVRIAIFVFIGLVGVSFISIPDFVDIINEELSGANRQASIEILDEATRKIEDRGFSLQDLTSEDFESSLSESEIEDIYNLKLKNGRYEVNIYFDEEENVVSIQKDYPEGVDVEYIVISVIFAILLCGPLLIVAFIGIIIGIYGIKETIVENSKKKEQDKEE